MSDYESYEAQETRRDFKKERKLHTKQDRSKYKKTDQDKIVSPTLSGKLGRVISLDPSTYYVLTDDDLLFTCSLKGTLKHEKTRNKNLIAIGDFVRFLPLNETQGLISGIEPRTSVLSRAKDKAQHVLAANIDQVLIVSSVVAPPLKHPLIDRYIIATRKGNMEPIIIINKIDLLPKEDEFVSKIKKMYQNLNIPCITISAITGEGLEELKGLMQNKTSVFSGQSGVGKTSLINEITSSNLRVGDIVSKTRKGSHTTTKATLIPLAPSGFCIDTPGIKSFGLWELTEQDIQDYFSDFLSYQCKYPNCTHTHEPECKVKTALDEGIISPYRYESYLTLLEEVNNEHHSTR